MIGCFNDLAFSISSCLSLHDHDTLKMLSVLENFSDIFSFIEDNMLLLSLNFIQKSENSM
jgi:hypothetical protein